MHAQNWNDVLTLLSMMIMADGKVYQEEVNAFKKAAVELRDKVCPNIMVTEQMAYDWYLHRRDRIAKNMTSVYYASTITKLLDNLNALPNKKELVLALIKVAIADGEKHHTENKILDQACETWELDIALAG